MKRLAFFFILLLLSACTCEETEFLIPQAPPPFQVSPAFDSGFYLFFNRDIDQETLIPGVTLLVEGENIDYNFQFESFPAYIFIRVCDFNCSTLNCQVRVRLVSKPSEKVGVRSRDGAYLDGDNNGSEGGNFVHDFTVETCDPGPRVTSPVLASTNQPTLNSGSRLTFVVEFNRPMRAASVVEGNNFLVQIPARNISRLRGSIFWLNDRSLRFQSEEAITDYCNFSPDCLLTIRLMLNANPNTALITDEKGIPLDGDQDNRHGGAFFAFYRVVILG